MFNVSYYNGSAAQSPIKDILEETEEGLGWLIKRCNLEKLRCELGLKNEQM